MRSYRVYENMNPQKDISGEDFDLVSQVNECMMLSRIFDVVKTDIARQGVGHCRRIVFEHNEEKDLRLKNYYDMMIIMKNLLSGSIRSESREIRVKTEISDGDLIVTVADDGTGISRKEKPFIFSPEFSTKDETGEDRKRGRGLLLYNVRKAVINSRGKLQIHSEENQGTTVIVRFPLTQVLADDNAKLIVMNK